MNYSEAAFETAIEAHLLANGYLPVPEKGYDVGLALFPSEVIAFIKATQVKEWQKLTAMLADKTEAQVTADLAKWLDTYGCLATLRHGFKCYGRTLRVAFFQAAHGLNAELTTRYGANRVGITRQLHYSAKNRNSLDVVLSVNGIPIATLELKNPLTNQTVENAVRQYRKDRDPREPIFEFKRRTLVHFAVDTEAVQMTTRLAGDATYFLPFNKGNDGGAGNPPDPEGRNYRTAYLWEEALQRDSLLDMLARFVHLQIEEKHDDVGRKVKKESLIFPRYHQLQAVRGLVNAAARQGIGHNYLVEHSAGSGKSNTIAWLAHRLASLHDDKDKRIFDSVIVVTDRTVLDRQLQDNIYQFEHRQGVVQKIDDDSMQLAKALESGVPIIITTLQKFPFVQRQLKKLADEQKIGTGTLATRNCAVIVDEAHSSQSGETATELKGVLGGKSLKEKAKALAEEEGHEGFEKIYENMLQRSQQENLSFFAFTATPKHKTLKIFGMPAHKYTMRQAIEEGFILDVLRNYTTYGVYYRLLKACEDDPNVERKQAARALARFMRLHPHEISQKTEVIIEHFWQVTRHKIGGRGKAMVVTSSRMEAVRFKQSFDKYIKAKKYPIKSLVAFSGTVLDDEVPGVEYTEEGMNNGVKEKELPEAFASDSYQVLLVAEKYQTGFDQPLLHTMYVNKRLAGIQAVQTLSRLNRVHPLKEDTFILDFIEENRAEVRAAFGDYLDGAQLGQDVDPARMYQVKAELEQSGIFLQEEIESFCAIYFQPSRQQRPSDHRNLNAALDPPVDRFRALLEANEEEAELWRGKAVAFRSLYSFLSQIIPYQDTDLEKLYTYLRHLATKLPRRKSGPEYQFDDDVRLQYYRLQKISEGSISLVDYSTRPLDGPKEVGSGLVREQEVPLSRLIDRINERFGTEFKEADQLFFDQIVEAALSQEGLEQIAQANPQDKFALVFQKAVETLFIERMDQNVDIFARYMNDPRFHEVVSGWLVERVYNRFTQSQEEDQQDTREG